MNYYYSTDGKQTQGPLGLADLQNLYAGGRLPAETQVCAEGAQEWQSAAAVLGRPGTPPPPPPLPMQGDQTGGVIPYKNPQALFAYYLGIFSLIPALGLIPAVPAVILGILGLRKRKKNPVIKGAVHAWIGIIIGGLSVTIHVTLVAILFLNARR
jgi:hypothetical protein